jgi:LuxR family transcriptional regulator, maltose regulon positive regulatory protein
MAGPGFGKSTLLRQALADVGDSRCDVTVRIPRAGMGSTALLASIVAAAQEAVPLPGAVPPSVEGFVDAVWSASPIEVCVVIDDAHRLSPAAVDVLLDVLDRLPGNGHLLIAGRPLPHIGLQRLAAARHAHTLTEDDLRFDADERLTFCSLRGTSPTGSPDGDGWPALLELELRTGRVGAMQYVIDEVVASLDPATLDACRRLAVLPVVHDASAAALLGRPVSAARVIGRLPLTRTDGDGVEIHELLRAALHDGWADDEYRKAVDAAVAAAIAGERYDEALELCTATAHQAGARAIARRLAQELQFGSTTVERRARTARLRQVLGDGALEVVVVDAVNRSLEDPLLARPALDGALQGALAAGDTELEALCRLRLADLAYHAADLASLTTQCDDVERLAAEGVRAAVRIAFLPRLWTMSLTNRVADVVPYLDDLRSSGVGSGNDDEAAQAVDAYRVWFLAYSGHVRAALDQLATSSHPPGGLFANRMGGFTLLQRWFLGLLTDTERRAVSALIDRIGASGQANLYVEGAASVALFHASAGEIDEAEHFVGMAHAGAHRLAPTAWARHTVAQARAALAVMHGDEAGAAAILSEAVPKEASPPFRATSTARRLHSPTCSCPRRDPCGRPTTSAPTTSCAATSGGLSWRCARPTIRGRPQHCPGTDSRSCGPGPSSRTSQNWRSQRSPPASIRQRLPSTGSCTTPNGSSPGSPRPARHRPDARLPRWPRADRSGRSNRWSCTCWAR